MKIDLSKLVQGEFTFRLGDTMADVCNVPDDKRLMGVWVVEAHEEPVFIGASGKQNGSNDPRKNGLRGRILYGKMMGDTTRAPIPRALAQKMQKRNIRQVHIKWYLVPDDEYVTPTSLKNQLIFEFESKYNRKPSW